MQVRHIASEGLDLGLPLRGQTALALAVSLGKVEEIFGGEDIWWRKYLAEKLFGHVGENRQSDNAFNLNRLIW